MKKLIHYNPDEAGQLQCDTPTCDYKEPEPRPFTKELIGMPCPKCNASLLTQRDYDDTVRHFKIIDIINKLFGWLGTEKPPKSGYRTAVRTHNGDVTIKKIEKFDRD